MTTIFKDKRAKVETYIVRVPLQAGGYQSKRFSKRKYSNPKESAHALLLRSGRKEWGVELWQMICDYGLVAVRKKTFRVSVIFAKQKMKNSDKCSCYFYVHWRERRGGELKKYTKWFRLDKFGGESEALKAANWYAAKKRAELLNTALSIPKEILSLSSLH